MGIEVVIVYLVVGTVETVTDPLEKHLLLPMSMTTVLQTTVTYCIWFSKISV